jgi:hypothetical protein
VVTVKAFLSVQRLNPTNITNLVINMQFLLSFNGLCSGGEGHVSPNLTKTVWNRDAGEYGMLLA